MPTAADTEKMGNSEVTNNTLQYTNSVLKEKKFFKKIIHGNITNT